MTCDLFCRGQAENLTVDLSFDGSGNDARAMSNHTDGFRKVLVKKSNRQITLMVGESSMTDRLEKTRGFASLNQLQTLNVVTKNALQLNVHDRLYCDGSTNRGNVVGPLALDALDDPDATWCLKTKDKFSLFGKHGPRIPVGGAAEDPDDGELTAPLKSKPRDKDASVGQH